jgi:hypothetical protein
VKKLLVAALATLTLAGIVRAEEAAPAYDTAPAEAPAAPLASVRDLWDFGGPGAQDHSQVVRWLRNEIRESGRHLRSGQYIRARRRLQNARDQIWSYPELHWTISRLEDAIGDIRRGSYNSADHTLRRLYDRLGQGGGGGGGGQLAEVIDDLRDAMYDFRRNDISGARMNLQAAYRVAVRSQWQKIRQEAEPIRQADQAAAYGQIPNATRITALVLRRLQSGGGGGGNDPDWGNRQEWRRDIRDLIDTIMDGNLRMARRDLETLKRDIRQDGHNWNQNRQYVQRLNYIGQNLYQGNQSWCIQELRQLSHQLNH